jgi:hypothetical protein
MRHYFVALMGTGNRQVGVVIVVAVWLLLSYMATAQGQTIELSIRLGETNHENGIHLASGGDVDTDVVSIDGLTARRTGNGQVLPSGNGNETRDTYMQFDVDDASLFEGVPTQRIQIQVEYYDIGTDSFVIQYDGSGTGGAFGDGRFTSTSTVSKSDSGELKVASFGIDDVYFGNRDNGADFRIDDLRDGPETIRAVVIAFSLPLDAQGNGQDRATGASSSTVGAVGCCLGTECENLVPDECEVRGGIPTTIPCGQVACSGDPVLDIAVVSTSCERPHPASHYNITVGLLATNTGNVPYRPTQPCRVLGDGSLVGYVLYTEGQRLWRVSDATASCALQALQPGESKVFELVIGQVPTELVTTGEEMIVVGQILRTSPLDVRCEDSVTIPCASCTSSVAMASELNGLHVADGSAYVHETFDEPASPGWDLGQDWRSETTASGRTVITGTSHDGSFSVARAPGSFCYGPNSALTCDLNLDHGTAVFHFQEGLKGGLYWLWLNSTGAGFGRRQAAGGESVDLADAPLCLSEGVWHEVAILNESGRLSLVINGQVVLSVVDPEPLPAGFVSLWALEPDSRVSVDDLAILDLSEEETGRVETGTIQVLAEESFEDPESSGWVFEREGKGWEPQSIVDGRSVLSGTSGDSEYITAWAPASFQHGPNSVLTCDLKLDYGAAAIYFQEGANCTKYWMWLHSNGVGFGKGESCEEDFTLVEAPVDLRAGGWHEVAIFNELGRLYATINGEVVLDVVDPEPLPAGSVSLQVLPNSRASFDSLAISALGGEEPSD